MANPWNEAWEEAEASVPPQVVMYATLEFRHPAFVDDSSPPQPIAIRVVANVPEDMQFTLEDGAPLNGGETVTFTAVELMAERPEFGEGRTPECRVTVDNVGRYLVPHLERAVGMKADLIVVYREYRSDDTSEPCYGPVEFVMRRVNMTGTALTGIARLDNLASKKFPNRVYTITEFPGLLP